MNTESIEHICDTINIQNQDTLMSNIVCDIYLCWSKVKLSGCIVNSYSLYEYHILIVIV